MYAGDDIEFRTNGWDQIVRDKFEEFEDKIALVYGDDDATHGEKIAIHGFLHRNWINAVGTWVAPGRGSLYDYWHTEVARKVGRLVFVFTIGKVRLLPCLMILINTFIRLADRGFHF